MRLGSLNFTTDACRKEQSEVGIKIGAKMSAWGKRGAIALISKVALQGDGV